MLTAKKGNTALCDYLLHNGADVALVDVKGSFLFTVLFRPPDDSLKVLYTLAPSFLCFFIGAIISQTAKRLPSKVYMGPRSLTKNLLKL